MSVVNSTDSMERKYQFNIQSSLLSPPEPTPHDSFSRASPEQTMSSHTKPLYPVTAGSFPMSPPVSPATKNIITEEPTPVAVRDPILYPNIDAQGVSSPQAPLFTDVESLATQRVVVGHVAARGRSLFRDASPPRQSEYNLALEFKSQMAKNFNKNPSLWFERERSFLLQERALQSTTKRYPTIAPAGHGRKNAMTGAGVKKPGAPHKARVVKPNVKRATPAPTGPAKRVQREDKDFSSLPDYSPPVSSLPNKPNSLKVDWKGAPMTLVEMGDHLELLHQDEIFLASNLRLDCATYLTSKRRIFIRRIECLKVGKEFRKTDAQQACKIDVNKASKLWQAFEKVGWLNSKWVEKYL
jgi:hypothetical protein